MIKRLCRVCMGTCTVLTASGHIVECDCEDGWILTPEPQPEHQDPEVKEGSIEV